VSSVPTPVYLCELFLQRHMPLYVAQQRDILLDKLPASAVILLCCSTLAQGIFFDRSLLAGCIFWRFWRFAVFGSSRLTVPALLHPFRLLRKWLLLLLVASSPVDRWLRKHSAGWSQLALCVLVYLTGPHAAASSSR